MQAHIQVQRNEEVVLRAKLEGLQTMQTLEIQEVRDEEKERCRTILDEETERREQTYKAMLDQR
eukprot:10915067-Prorocentrum_lima.AAC.1